MLAQTAVSFDHFDRPGQTRSFMGTRVQRRLACLVATKRASERARRLVRAVGRRKSSERREEAGGER